MQHRQVQQPKLEKKNSMTKRWGFQRDMLPSPHEYYSDQALNKFKVNSAGNRATACCPFHNDRTPSLSMNLETGWFKCWGCGTSGSGVLDFHMQLHLYDFKTACQELGAWV